MNDVVNPNTGLYHDQSLFNLTEPVKALPVRLCVVVILGMTIFFVFPKVMRCEKKLTPRMIIFFSVVKILGVNFLL